MVAPHSRTPRISAVMLVRNEAAIIASSVGHILRALGVQELIVADNESTDGTVQILKDIAHGDDRLQIRSAPGEYRQAETMTLLYHEARERGAEWVLPSDADEFLWLDGRSLPDVVAEAGDVSGFNIPLRNFVQRSYVADERTGSLETMTFSASPVGTVLEARDLVESGRIPFLRSRYPPKILLRARSGVEIHTGQHGADGLGTPLIWLDRAEVLHAPMRSRSSLEARIAIGRRLNALPSTHGWHVKRLILMNDAALEREWRENSVNPRTLVRGWYRPDGRLARIARRLRGLELTSENVQPRRRPRAA